MKSNASTKLIKLAKRVSKCQLCKLARTRTQTVFGSGKADAKIIFIGEAPGRREDLAGLAFIGPSGQLLTNAIEEIMLIPTNEVYITNLVKCRPTVNLEFQKDRAPEREEQEACLPYLIEQIEIIAPKIIVTVGGSTTKFLLNTKLGITKLRGKWFKYQDIPVMPIYHPSYILRNGGEKSSLKKQLLDDLKLVTQKSA